MAEFADNRPDDLDLESAADATEAVLARKAALMVPEVPAIAPLDPAALVLEPPPCLPSLTPSTLLEAVAMAMEVSDGAEEQTQVTDARWDRTITFPYSDKTTTALNVSGNHTYERLTPNVVRVLFAVITKWTDAGAPRALPMTVADIVEMTGANRRDVSRLLQAAGSLIINGKVRHQKEEPQDLTAGTFSAESTTSRVRPLTVDSRWLDQMDRGMQALIDPALLHITRLRSGLALRLYLYLASECARGNFTHLSPRKGPAVLTHSAFDWHQRLHGFELKAGRHTSRYYSQFEDALYQLASFGVVGPSSAVLRPQRGVQGASLKTMVNVELGPAIEVLSLLRATSRTHSQRDRLLLAHLGRNDLTPKAAMDVLANGHEAVLRALLQLYYRQYNPQLKLPKILKPAGFLVDATRENHDYATENDALEWAQALMRSKLPAGDVRRKQLPPEAPAISGILRKENIAQSGMGAPLTHLFAMLMWNANLDGDTLTLTMNEMFVEETRRLLARNDERHSVWKVARTCFPEVQTIVFHTSMDGELDRLTSEVGRL